MARPIFCRWLRIAGEKKMVRYRPHTWRRIEPRCTAPGGCTSRTFAIRSSMATTRDGTCTRRNCLPATPRFIHFFCESIDAASERLRNFISKAAQATLAGDVFDDAATGQGLLNFFLAAINCGAVSTEEALPLTGLTLAELRTGSFLKILSGRGAQA